MRYLLLPVFIFVLSACAKVGSAAWCENLAAKAKGDWTANEAGDYTRYCVIGMDPDEK
jgi:hypothetical protein